MPRVIKSRALLQRERQHLVLTMYAQGKTPDQIALDLKMGVGEVTADIGQATDRLLSHFTCPPQHTFIRYAVFNLSIIRKLQQIIERFEADDKTVQYNSIISALKTQSDLNDKILEKGIEYGVIEHKRVSSAVKHPQDIKAMLKKEILSLSSLLDEVDLSISFHAARRSYRLKEERKEYEASISYSPIVIKPLIGPGGVLRVIPDWKYPKRSYGYRVDGRMAALSPAKCSPDQQEHFRIAQEMRKLSTEIDKAQLLEPAMSVVVPRIPNATRQPGQDNQEKQEKQETSQGQQWLMKPSLSHAGR